jgi:hypothetical protein
MRLYSIVALVPDGKETVRNFFLFRMLIFNRESKEDVKTTSWTTEGNIESLLESFKEFPSVRDYFSRHLNLDSGNCEILTPWKRGRTAK